VSRREYQDALGFRAQVSGYLPHRWPAWFQPTLVDMQPEAVGPFTHSFRLTQAGDVHVLPTPGHTPGHVSVLVNAPEANTLLAGDVSHTQALMLQQRVDGVSSDRAVSQDTLAKVRMLCQSQSAVYLPSHDPDSLDRLMQRTPAIPPGEVGP